MLEKNQQLLMFPLNLFPLRFYFHFETIPIVMNFKSTLFLL